MATTHILPSQVQSQLGQQLRRRRRCSVDFNFTVPRFFFYFFHPPSRLQTQHSLGDRRHRRQQQLQQRGRSSSSASSEHQIISPCPPLMEDHPQRQQLCSSETEQENRYSREMDVAVRAVQMACWICQKVQDTLVFQTHDNNSSSGSSSNNSQVHSKDDNSPVTIADWSVQATISWLLSEHFKSENVSIAAEEDVHALSKADGAGLLKAVVKTVNEALCDAPRFGLMGPEKNLDAMQVLDAISRCRSTGTLARRFWALDPVDGTLGFVRGDQYAVALSLIEDGKVVLGVLGCPNYPMRKEWLNYHHRYHRIITKLTLSTSESWDRGCVLYAREGSGEAWMQPLLHKSKSLEWPNSAVPVRVSPVDNPASATFCEPVEKANSSHSFTAGLAHSVGLRKQPLRVYSMVKYAAIARGDAEIFMKFARAGYKEKIWDHAAGVVIVQEAGGVVTDARGRPLDFSRGIFLEGLDRGIIACSGSKLHERIIKAVDASWDSSCL